MAKDRLILDMSLSLDSLEQENKKLKVALAAMKQAARAPGPDAAGTAPARAERQNETTRAVNRLRGQAVDRDGRRRF